MTKQILNIVFSIILLPVNFCCAFWIFREAMNLTGMTFKEFLNFTSDLNLPGASVPRGLQKRQRFLVSFFREKKLRPTKIHSASVDVRNLYASRSCCADARRILRKRSRASEIRFYREFDSCPYQHRPGYLGENLQKQSSAG